MHALAFVVCFSLFALSACPHPLPDPVPASPQGIAACSSAAMAYTEDVCEGFFTADAVACARCQGGSGCYSRELAVYCASGACVDDHRCSYQEEGGR